MIEPDGTQHRGSKGVLHVFHGLGWRVSATVAGMPPFGWVTEGCYRVFAANRRFFARFVFWPAHPDVKDF